MKRIIISSLLIATLLVLVGGNTHRWLPADSDPCQQDMTHKGHVNELPMFHCIGHTEFEVDTNKVGLEKVKKWDHIHPWMDRNWHLEMGFSIEQTEKLLSATCN